jgi:phage major head subunit gpT-like protein
MTAYANIESALQTINTTLVTGLADIYNSPYVGNYKVYTDERTSDTLYNYLVTPGAVGAMREWIGAKIIKQFRMYSQSVRTKKWENTFAVSRDDLKFDRTGVVQQAINSFLRNTAKDLDRQAFTALIANATGIDGVSLLSSSHTQASSTGGTQSNTGTSVLSYANFVTARNAMLALSNESNDLMNASPTTIVVGPALLGKARELFQANTRLVATNISGTEATSGVMDTAAISNVWMGELKVVEERRLTGTYANYWYLIDENYGSKPLVQITTEPLHVVSLLNEDSGDRFYNDQYLWSIEGHIVWTPYAYPAIYGNLAAA